MVRQHGAAAGIGVFGLAAVLISAPAVAQADEQGGSFAEGRFLSGTILDADLAALVELDAATAFNDGSAPVSEEHNPFSVTALGEVTAAPGAVAVSEADGADAGAIGQYAIARDDGSSYASSGLVGSNGAVGVSPAPGSVATVDLGVLLGDAMPEGLTGLRLEAAGIAAEAEATLGDVRGDYTLADARLVLEVPAVATADDRAEASILPIETSLAGLGGSEGPLAGVVDGVLAGVGLAGVADVTATVETDLDALIDSIRDVVLHDDAMTVDLGTGIITVDLASLPDGPGLNDQEPGTELLTDGVVRDIVAGVERLLGGYLEDVEVRVGEAVRAARVDLSAHARVLDDVQTGETVRTITTPITQLIDALTGEVLGTVDANGVVTSLVPGVSGDVLAELMLGTGSGVLGLGGLFGGGIPDVTTRVVAEVSTVTEPLFSTLESGADVRIAGDLASLWGGTVADASAGAVLFGAPVALDAQLIVDGLADAVRAAIPAGTTDGLGDRLGSEVIDPILGTEGDEEPGQPGTGGGEDGGIADLAGLVSLRTNVQSYGSDGAFTQTALRIEVLGGELATVDLANATVGPNAASGPGDPGGTGGGTDPAGVGSGLAFTGFALDLIALLAAALLGLGALAVWRARRAAMGADAEVSDG